MAQDPATHSRVAQMIYETIQENDHLALTDQTDEAELAVAIADALKTKLGIDLNPPPQAGKERQSLR